jgi:hypothetical protein
LFKKEKKEKENMKSNKFMILILYLLIISVNSKIKDLTQQDLDDFDRNDSITSFNWTLTDTECNELKPFSIYYSILLLIALTANFAVLWVLIKRRKELLNHINQVQLVLIIINLLGTLFGLPLVIATLFSCKYENKFSKFLRF